MPAEDKGEIEFEIQTRKRIRIEDPGYFVESAIGMKKPPEGG